MSSHGIAQDEPLTVAPPRAARFAFARNVGTNALYLVLSSVLMFWYTPFLLKRLGEASFGIIALANGLALFAVIISSSLNISLSRQLTLDLALSDFESANETFNTALRLSVAGLVISLPVAAGLILLAPRVVTLPSGIELQCQALFAAVLFTTLLAMVSGCFGVASLVRQRFDLRNLARGLVLVSRVGIVLAFASAGQLSLWHITLGFLASAFIGLLGDIVICRTLLPELRVSKASINPGKVAILLNTGVWSIGNQFGVILLMQADIFIVSALFGPDATGRYGALLVLVVLIHALAETIISVLWPLILAYFAAGRLTEMTAIAARAIRLLALAMAIPVGLLVGFANPFLTLWLGPTYADLDNLLTALIVCLPLYLSLRPVSYILTAHDKVRAQALGTLAFACLHVLLGITLASALGWGPIGIAVSGACVWTARNAIFLPAYTRSVTGTAGWSLVSPALPGVAATLGLALCCRGLIFLWPPHQWIGLGTQVAFMGAFAASFLYAVALHPADRMLLRRCKSGG